MKNSDNGPTQDEGANSNSAELADIVPIAGATTRSPSKRYLKAATAARDGLREASTILFTGAINLLMTAEWIELDDACEEGQQLCFDDDDLATVKDHRVQTLRALYLKLDDAADDLSELLAASKPPPTKRPHDPDPFSDRHTHFSALLKAKQLPPPTDK